MKKHFTVTHFTLEIICTCLYITCNKKMLFFLRTILSYCGYSPTSPFFLLLSEHKHCDNAATNSNSENARSRMVASLRGSVGMGTKEESSTGRVLAAVFHHVTVRSRLARILKLVNRLFLSFSKFFRAAVNREYGGPPVCVYVCIYIYIYIYIYIFQCRKRRICSKIRSC